MPTWAFLPKNFYTSTGVLWFFCFAHASTSVVFYYNAHHNKCQHALHKIFSFFTHKKSACSLSRPNTLRFLHLLYLMETTTGKNEAPSLSYIRLNHKNAMCYTCPRCEKSECSCCTKRVHVAALFSEHVNFTERTIDRCMHFTE